LLILILFLVLAHHVHYLSSIYANKYNTYGEYNMFNLGKKLGFAALLAFGAVSSAQASLVVLDTFDYDTEIHLNAPGTDERFDINAFLADVSFDLSLDSGFLAGLDTFNAGTGVLSWSNIGNATSTLTLDYSEFGGLSSGSTLDLTGGGSEDAFYFDVLFSDFGFDIDIFVGSASGVSHATDSSTGINVLTRNTLGFDSFSTVAGAGADFSDATFVRIVLSSNAEAVDLLIEEFGTIPEPTTLAIFGLGLLGLGLSRKKQAK
jgi:hypothetical protein